MDLGKLIPATFIDRPNRFLARVRLNNIIIPCFIANPGRLEELLTPGVEVYLKQTSNKYRKTLYTIILVKYGYILVSIDSWIPNSLAKEAINIQAISEFAGYTVEKSEILYGSNRLDFVLSKGTCKLLLEVKSCNLVDGEVAYFPDAPTLRGVRQLETLSSYLSKGRSAILFIIQRSGARVLKPNEKADFSFSVALREANKKGVEVLAYDCEVNTTAIKINKRVPVEL